MDALTLQRAWKSFARTDLAVLGLLLIVAILFSCRQILSPDIGIHLRTGQWILENRAFPDTDPFTYTASTHAYIDTYWLYQVAVAGAEWAGGAFGIVALHAMLLGVGLALLAMRTLPTAPQELRIGPQILLALAVKIPHFIAQTGYGGGYFATGLLSTFRSVHLHYRAGNSSGWWNHIMKFSMYSAKACS